MTAGRIVEREGTWATAPERPHGGEARVGASRQADPNNERFESRCRLAQVERGAQRPDGTAPPPHELEMV